MTSVHALAASRGTWTAYGGAARQELTLVLLAVAVGVMVAGFALRLPAGLRRPSRPVVIWIVAIWIVAIPAFLVCAAIYVQQLSKQHSFGTVARDPITPVTLGAAVVTFVIIFVLHPDRSGTRLVSAAIGAMAGPMIFELPFDLIVMTRTYPVVLPDPGWYRVLFFAPLFLIELTTLALLTLSPMVKLSRSAFIVLALMFLVFAVWGLQGFGYPLAPLPIALNAISKILAFGVVLCLFVPQRARSGSTGTGKSRDRQHLRTEPQAHAVD